MRKTTVAVTQMASDWNVDANLSRAERLVRDPPARGAQNVLLQELFEPPY
ncbi:nitrilase-related carbon-nitrogen hydrolase, partial [Burkholderia pseudomallei]